MSLRGLAPFALFLLLVSACKGAAPAAEPSGPTPADSALADASAPVAVASGTASASVDAKDTLTLNHGPCYGHCEELTVTVTGDGTVTVAGRGSSKSLDAKATGELFAQAAAAFEPAPQCPAMPTDLQRVTVSLVQHGAEHKAVHIRSGSCSKALDELEKKLLSLR